MKIIEAVTYERFAWSEESTERYVYICVPVTLLMMQYGGKTQTQFIFWN
jgi:hypothetical protein